MRSEQEQAPTMYDPQQLLDGVDEVVFATDLRGRWTYLNSAWRKVSGYAPDTCLGDYFLSYFHPEERAHCLRYFRELVVGKEETLRIDLRLADQDGVFHPVEVVARLLRDDGEKPLAVVGLLRDISWQKQLETRLEAAGAALREEREQRAREVAGELRHEQGLLALAQALFSDAEQPVAVALRALRETAGVCRAYVYENVTADGGTLVARQLYEACAPDVVPQLTNPQWQYVPYETSGLGRWLRRLSDGHAVGGSVSLFPQAEQVVLQSRQVQSLLVWPLAVDGQWYGFIGFDDTVQARQWDEASVHLLQSAAGMIGAYLSRTWRLEKSEQALSLHERQMDLASRVVQRLNAADQPEQLYGWLVEEINGAFGYACTLLHRVQAGERVATLVAASGEAGRKLMHSGLQIPLGFGLVGLAAARGEALLCPDVDVEPRWQPTPELPETKGELAVPIMQDDTVLGVLSIHTRVKDRLSESDQRLLALLTGQLASAIERHRLYAEVEDQLAELHNLQRLMSRDGWLRVHETRHPEETGYHFDRRTLDVHTPQARADLKVNGSRPRADRLQATQVPLQVRGATFGVLGVNADTHEPLSEDEEGLLQAISEQVSEALENARLLTQTQKRAIELETVARVSAATSTILDVDKLLLAVVELTKRSFSLYHAHIYLVDEERGQLVLAAGSGDAGQAMVSQGWQIDLEHPASIVARAARERKSVIVNDVSGDRSFLPNPLLPATKSELAVPMVASNRLLGVLDVQSDAINNFSQDDARIQWALASQIAIALQNARLYQEQLQTAEKLREFDRLKSEFLASMSHELRTPLNSIIGFADVLLEGIDGELNERMLEDVQLIRNSGQHLRNLIGDILDMSKIEAGMMDLRREVIDLRRMVPDLEAFARTQGITYDRQLEFRVEIAPGVGTIYADPTRLKQVLFNLISNAVKFTDEGSITLAIERTEKGVVMSVSDTGIGIKEEDLPVVFEEFRQIDGSLTRTAGGTGLGLPISKSLVELHGGEIWVKSQIGEGTTFFFTIPGADSTESKEGDAS